MTTSKTSINHFLANPIKNSDEFSNFCDWSCSAVESRMLALVPKLKFLVKEGIIDGDNTYVQFKNIAPCEGNLYDEIRILTLDSDKFLGCFTPNYLGGFTSRFDRGNVTNRARVWFFDDNNKRVSNEFKNWTAFKKEIKTNAIFKNTLIQNFRA